jgi:hypothetical protein
MGHRAVRYAYNNGVYTFWFSGYLKAIGLFRLDAIDEAGPFDICTFIDIFTGQWMTVQIEGDVQYGEAKGGTALLHCPLPDVWF